MLTNESHNQLQREYYAGNLKKTIRPTSTPYVRRHVDEVVRFGGLHSGERVLDAGCGAGRFSFLLAESGMEVEGLELSADLCNRLREFDDGRHNLRVECGDICDPPAAFLDRFDAVTGFFMLHHIIDLKQAFCGVHRMLRPGGRAVFVEPNAWNPLYYAQVGLTPGMHWAAEKGIRNMRPNILTRAMLDAGLAVPEFDTFGFFPPFLRNLPGGGLIESILERTPGLKPVLPFLLIRAQRL